MTKVEERKEAIRLRKRGMTYDEIKQQLGVSKGSLSLWLSDLKLSSAAHRRVNKRFSLAQQKAGEHARKRWCQKRSELYQLAKKEIGVPKFTKDTLAYVGAALYWAEGDKDLGMSFSNSDVAMLQLYLKWLRKIIKVPNDQITCMINVYLNNGISLEEIHAYWSEQLGIPLLQFTKAVVDNLPKSSKKKVKNVLVYGTMKVTVKKPMQYAAKLAVLLELMGKDIKFVELSAAFR